MRMHKETSNWFDTLNQLYSVLYMYMGGKHDLGRTDPCAKYIDGRMDLV